MDRLRALRLSLRDRYAAGTVDYCTVTHPATCPACFERDGLSQSLRESERGYDCRGCGEDYAVTAPKAPAGASAICAGIWQQARLAAAAVDGLGRFTPGRVRFPT